MVLESVWQSFGKAVSDPVTYWILAGLVAIVILFLAKIWDFPQRQAAIISLIVSVFLLEIILKYGLGLVGIKVDYGTFLFEIPHVYKTELTTGVMLMRFLDFIFNFGLFRTIGLPYFEAYASTITVAPVHASTLFGTISSIFSAPLNVFVFLYVNADGIIDFIFFYYFFYAILVLGSDMFGESDAAYYLAALVGGGAVFGYFWFHSPLIAILLMILALILIVLGRLNGDAKDARIYSFGLALVPLILYSYYISNPFEEYHKALPDIQKLIMFIEHGNQLSLVIYFLTMIISFVLVMQIVVVIINLLHKTITTTVRPSMQGQEWTVSHQGIAFDYTLAFAIMYALDGYSFYVFFPAAVIYSTFKNLSSGAVDIAKGFQEKREMQEFLTKTMGDASASRTSRIPAQTRTHQRPGSGWESSNVLLIAVIIALLALAYMLGTTMKWI